jgi:hypothetical protein
MYTSLLMIILYDHFLHYKFSHYNDSLDHHFLPDHQLTQSHQSTVDHQFPPDHQLDHDKHNRDLQLHLLKKHL